MTKIFCSFVISIFFLIQFEGCTVWGTVIGGVMDLSQPPDTVLLSEFAKYEKWDTVTVGRTNDSSIRGEFMGMREYDDAEYTDLYNSALSHRTAGVVKQPAEGETRFPGIGEPLDLVIRDGWEKIPRQGAFHGFDKNALESVSTPPPSQLMHFGFPEIMDVRNSAGYTFNRKAMESAITRGEIPFRTAVRLWTKDSTFTIPGEQVRFGYQYHSHHHVVNGLLIGLGIDAVMATLIRLWWTSHTFKVG